MNSVTWLNPITAGHEEEARVGSEAYKVKYLPGRAFIQDIL